MLPREKSSVAGVVTAKINPAPPSLAGSDAGPADSLRVSVAADRPTAGVQNARHCHGKTLRWGSGKVSGATGPTVSQRLASRACPLQNERWGLGYGVYSISPEHPHHA